LPGVTIGLKTLLGAAAAVVLVLSGATACASSSVPAANDRPAVTVTPTPSSTFVRPFRLPSAAETAAFLRSLRGLASKPGMSRLSAKDTTDLELKQLAEATCVGMAGGEDPAGSIRVMTFSGWPKPMAVAMLRAAVAPGSFCPQEYTAVDTWFRGTSGAA
jgi:hypothetical protein